MQELIIYTDGSAHYQTRFGGYGVVIIEKHQEIELSGGFSNVTNNMMELFAVVAALQYLLMSGYDPKQYKITIYSDSQYVVKGYNEWLPMWRRNHWKTQTKEWVKNSKLWKMVAALAQGMDIKFKWVRGHNGDEYNERADKLAGEAYRAEQQKVLECI